MPANGRWDLIRRLKVNIQAEEKLHFSWKWSFGLVKFHTDTTHGRI